MVWSKDKVSVSYFNVALAFRERTSVKKEEGATFTTSVGKLTARNTFTDSAAIRHVSIHLKHSE
jgi:hypothetical protein